MAGAEYDLKNDEMERNALDRTIGDVERTIATSGSTTTLQLFLQNARSRVSILDKRIKDTQDKQESKARDHVVEMMVEREKALSTEEKQTFGEFLRKDFFTKADFGKLETFYANTWDRLSKEGKDEMSGRVWEGVRRSEYEISVLPKAMREKEMAQAYDRLKSPTASEALIPQQDRSDYINNYDEGKKEEAAKVLDRPSFKENMFSKPQASDRARLGQDVGKLKSAEKMVADAKEPDAKKSRLDSAKGSGIADESLATLEMKGVKLAKAPENFSPPAINASTNEVSRSGSKTI